MFLSLLKKKNKKNPNLVLDFFFETGFYSVAQASLEFIVNWTQTHSKTLIKLAS